MPFGKPADDVDAWRFPARVERVVDGDTLDIVTDLGFNTKKSVRVRLYGVNTNEIYGGVSKDSEEYQAGIEQKQFVEDWVDALPEMEWPLVAYTKQAIGIYGRYTADLENTATGESLTVALHDEFDLPSE